MDKRLAWMIVIAALMVPFVQAYTMYFYDDGRWGSNTSYQPNTSTLDPFGVVSAQNWTRSVTNKWICFPNGGLSACPFYGFNGGAGYLLMWDGNVIYNQGHNSVAMNYTGGLSGKRTEFSLGGMVFGDEITAYFGQPPYAGEYVAEYAFSSFVIKGYSDNTNHYGSPYGPTEFSVWVKNASNVTVGPFHSDGSTYAARVYVEVSAANNWLTVWAEDLGQPASNVLVYNGSFVGLAANDTLVFQHDPCCGGIGQMFIDDVEVKSLPSPTLSECYQESATEASACGGLGSGTVASTMSFADTENVFDGVRETNGSYTWCYQESANVSNQSGTDTGGCGLNYSGYYLDSGIANDGYIVAYKKPAGAVGFSKAMWARGNSTTPENYTIPFECWTADDEYVFLSVSSWIGGYSGWSTSRLSCYAGEAVSWGVYNTNISVQNVQYYSPPPPSPSHDSGKSWFDGNWSTFDVRVHWNPYWGYVNGTFGDSSYGNMSQVYGGTTIGTGLAGGYSWEEGMWWGVDTSGNYDPSFMTQRDQCGGEEILINYTKPSTAVEARWNISAGMDLLSPSASTYVLQPNSDNFQEGDVAVRIQDSCFNAYPGKLVLKIANYPVCWSNQIFQYWCHNGTGWEGVRSRVAVNPVTPERLGTFEYNVDYSSAGTMAGYVWDEGMTWTMCVPNWTCGAWGECQPSGTQTCESYVDTNSCGQGRTGAEPELTQSCDYEYGVVEEEGAGIVKSSSFVQQETYAPTSIITQDFSVSSIISASGVYSYIGQTMSFENATDEAAVLAVDTAGSTYACFATVSSTEYITYVSTPPVNGIVTADNLSMGGVVCAYDPDTNMITATAVGVAAPDKNLLKFQGKYTVTQTGITETDIKSTSLVRTFAAPETGTYEITVTAFSSAIPAEQVSATCMIDVRIPEQPEIAAQRCTVGYDNADGEFNYVESPETKGWLFGAGSTANTVDRQYLVFSAQDGYQSTMYYPMACDDQQITLSTRMRAPLSNDDLGVARFELLARSTVNTESSIVPIGMVTVTRTDKVGEYVVVTAEGSGNQTVVYRSNSSIGWLRIDLIVDRGAMLMQVEVTPETSSGMLLNKSTAIVPVTNNVPGQFAGVGLVGINSEYVDYVRVVNHSNVIVPLLTAYQLQKRALAKQHLPFCEGDPGRDYDPNVRLKYDNVRAYCDAISIFWEHIDYPGYCTYKDLQEIVMAQPRCYAEAYAYCVNVTFPKTAGFEESGVAEMLNLNSDLKPLEGITTGADGATICASALAVSVIAKRQAIPFMNVITSLMMQYLWIVVILVVTILIVLKVGPKR